MTGRGLGHAFWPFGEAAQADYEALRAAAGVPGLSPSSSLSAARFARRGLAGLIAWPESEPVFTGPVVGAARPKWSPHDDPRMDALAAGFAFLLDVDSGWAAADMMEELVR